MRNANIGARAVGLLVGFAFVFDSVQGRSQEASPSAFPRARSTRSAGGSGSTTDTLAGFMPTKLARTWGKPVIVENISGGMVLGAAQVFRMAPDGYTLMVSPPAQVTFIHLLYRDLAFEPAAFRAGRAAGEGCERLVARNDLRPPVSRADRLCPANPGKVTYGSQEPARPRTSPQPA